MSLPGHKSIFRKHFLEKKVKALSPKVAETIIEDAPISSAIKTLAEKEIGSLIVVNNQNKVTGIFTERDIITRIALKAVDIKTAQISTVMTQNPEILKENTSIARALYMMSSGGYRHLIIQNKEGETVKVLSVKDFISFFYKSIAKKHVGPETPSMVDDNLVDEFFNDNIDVLTPSTPASVQEKSTVEHFLKVLKSHKIGSAIVLDQYDAISGIITERDYIKELAGRNRPPQEVPIAELMTKQPHTLLHSSTISLAFDVMANGGYRHIPVVDHKEKLTGILSVKNFYQLPNCKHTFRARKKLILSFNN